MQLRKEYKVQRNSLCPCGSGKKYKKCCLIREEEQIARQLEVMRMVEKSGCICNRKCACEEIKEDT